MNEIVIDKWYFLPERWILFMADLTWTILAWCIIHLDSSNEIGKQPSLARSPICFWSPDHHSSAWFLLVYCSETIWLSKDKEKLNSLTTDHTTQQCLCSQCFFTSYRLFKDQGNDEGKSLESQQNTQHTQELHKKLTLSHSTKKIQK